MFRYLNENFLGLFFLFISAFFDTLVAGLIKTVFNRIGVINTYSVQNLWVYLLKLLVEPRVWLAAFFFTVGPLFMLLGLNRLKITESYPMVVFSHMFFISLAGYFFLNEYINPKQFLGWALMLAGLYVFYSA